MAIPRLRKNGVLPRGVHPAPLAEVRKAFGGKTARRAELMLALEELVERCRRVGIKRILINGSFVTAKKEPRDVDVVLLLTSEFGDRLMASDEDATWLHERMEEKKPKPLDVHIAMDEEEWKGWIRMFELDVWSGRKGLIEVRP